MFVASKSTKNTTAPKNIKFDVYAPIIDCDACLGEAFSDKHNQMDFSTLDSLSFFSSQSDALDYFSTYHQSFISYMEKQVSQVGKTIICNGSRRQSLDADMMNAVSNANLSFVYSLKMLNLCLSKKQTSMSTGCLSTSSSSTQGIQQQFNQQSMHLSVSRFLLEDIRLARKVGDEWVKIENALVDSNGSYLKKMMTDKSWKKLYQSLSFRWISWLDRTPTEFVECKAKQYGALMSQVTQQTQDEMPAVPDWDDVLPEACQFDDEHKIVMLFSHMQHVANNNPGKRILFEFFDDREDILANVQRYFIKNQDRIPKGCQLRCAEYYPQINKDVVQVVFQGELKMGLSGICGTGKVYVDYVTRARFFYYKSYPVEEIEEIDSDFFCDDDNCDCSEADVEDNLSPRQGGSN